MTRIKKRRSGKNRTEDQKKSAAGKRRARKAENAAPAKVQGPKPVITPEQKAAYKKSFQPAPAGRRGRVSASKAVPGKKLHNDVPNDHKTAAPAKATGKTRSAGARRVAVAKSIAGSNSKKSAGKKPVAAKKEATGEGKPAKGFAPWNKGKFRSKNKPV